MLPQFLDEDKDNESNSMRERKKKLEKMRVWGRGIGELLIHAIGKVGKNLT